MAEPIGRADWELRADQSGLVKDLGDAEKKVAASGATVEKSAFNTGKALQVAGVAGAVGFGLMAKGALEMEDAQGKFQAATGRSSDEAVQFSKDMNGIVGTNATVGLSFSKISAAGTEVARQFGLTGKANQDMTQQFAAFAKVTGGDVVDSINAADDTLDAFHRPATDATKLMDLLVASNQKYGTEVGPQTVEMLGKMAPALNALGASMEDGVGLLNMFESSGLDAAGAMRGLNTAVKNLPPGTTLNDFIKHLQDVKAQGLDPTAEAIKVFGAKAGVGIVNALQPGMDGLDAYKVSAEDADGAVTTASDHMVTTGDKIKMFAEKAGAAMRELGQEFGPLASGAGGLVTAFMGLGPKLTGPLTEAFKGIGGVLSGALKGIAQKIIPTAVAEGTAVGAAEGAATTEAATGSGILSKFLTKFGLMTPAKVGAAIAAGEAEGAAEGAAAAEASTGPSILAKFKSGGGLMGAAMGVGLVIAVAAIAEEYGPQIGQAGNDLGRKFFGGVAQTMGSTESKGILYGTVFDSLTDGVHSGIDAFMDSPVARFNFFKDGRLFWMSPSAAEQAANDAMEALGPHLEADAADRLPAAGEVAAGAFSDGFTSSGSWGDAGQTGASSIFNQFNKFWNDHLPEMEAQGAAATAGLVHGLQKGLPDAHQTWKDYVKGMHDALDPAKEEAWLTGKLTSQKLQKGLESENPFVRQSAIDTRDALQKQLDDLQQLGYNDGVSLGKGTATGVTDQVPVVTQAASDYGDQVSRLKWSTWGQNVGTTYGEGIAKGINGVNFTGKINHLLDTLKGFSPPKTGPLSDIDKWGANVGQAWVDPFVATIADGSARLDAALVGYNLDVAGGAGGMSLAGGSPLSVSVTVNGVAGDPQEIGDAVAEKVRIAVMDLHRLAQSLPASRSGRPE